MTFEIYRSTGGTLYDFMQAHYPRMRRQIQSHKTCHHRHFFENLYRQEQELILQHKRLPSRQQFTSAQISHDALKTLFDLIYVTQSDAPDVNLRVPFLSSTGYLKAWKDLNSIMQNTFSKHHATAILPLLFCRAHASSHPDDDFIQDKWGYWTAEECQHIHIFLQTTSNAQVHELNPIRTAILQQGSHCKILAFIQYLIDALALLKPGEGLLGYLYVNIEDREQIQSILHFQHPR